MLAQTAGLWHQAPGDSMCTTNYLEMATLWDFDSINQANGTPTKSPLVGETNFTATALGPQISVDGLETPQNGEESQGSRQKAPATSQAPG